MTRDLTTEGPVPGQERIDVGALRHMSLCTGYGGIDIALERAFGAETVAVSDIDPGACKILAHRYPRVPNIGDMTRVDWREWVGKVDIISGGTPCQDLSSAGRRRGMTEGTRSNLWVAMRDAIATIRPQLIVWENVRGAYSASADSDLEPCPGCVGTPGQHGPVLRALGRVLGDLATLGYDAWWYGLRASDVGAAHHRFRVFVFAVRRDSADALSGRLGRLAREAGRLEIERALATGRGEVSDVLTLPTPTVQDSANVGGPSQALRNTPPLNSVAAHLPSPTANLGSNGGGQHPDKRKAGGHSVSIEDAVHALPTPSAADGNGGGRSSSAGHQKTLPGEARNLPTPRATDGTKGGPNQRGSSGDLMLSSVAAHLPTPRATRGGSSTETARLLLTPDDSGFTTGFTAEFATTGRGTPSHGYYGRALEQDWREYEPAIRRQEAAFGSPAPLPTEPNKNGKPRLSAEFSSWLMGLEPGWITDTPGITRNEALKAAGNGVVPQQCEAAARRFLADYMREVAA